MNIPVYIVTGFLGAGKTKFVTEMLTDEGFSEGEKTLLLCCEEGEEEYDPEVLKRCNTTLVTLEEPRQIAGKRLMRLNREHQPERVIVEYNSTWMMETLYAAEKPDSWTLAQIIDLVDASTFELYLKNMRKYMADGLKEADLVITGEGRLDAQTAMGKAPVGVAKLAKSSGKPVIAFSGCVTDDATLLHDHGIDAFFPILRGVVSLEDAMKKETARRNLTETAYQVFRLIRHAPKCLGNF